MYGFCHGKALSVRGRSLVRGCGRGARGELEPMMHVWRQSPQRHAGQPPRSEGKRQSLLKLFLHFHNVGSWPICPEICFLFNEKFVVRFVGMASWMRQQYRCPTGDLLCGQRWQDTVSFTHYTRFSILCTHNW